MGYESIAHEGERNNCFSKIQLVGQKNIKTKHLSQVEGRLQSSFTHKTLQIWRRFSLLIEHFCVAFFLLGEGWVVRSSARLTLCP